jgi:hypothetical protein
MHGGYKSLIGGMPHEALIDLTGYPTTNLHFKDPIVKKMIEEGKLWELMKHYN